ncbi:MAG TPA: hypothetical protein VHE99_08530 [Gammaproteobacteria bacterium]|nr:hypothetical protein [Gammaproteobacteria bacterium]
MTSRANLEQLTWNQIRKEVTTVNPELALIIDKISPSDKYWVAKTTYPYGSNVMEKSLLMLPNSKNLIVPITDASIDSVIREGLGYNLHSNPVSLVLKNSFEIFLPLADRTIPLSGLIYPGQAFGAWRVVNPKKTEHPIFIWDMTAGARSVFMLPKITETKKHMQLKKAYNLTVSPPRSMMEHWEIFRQLAKHPKFKQPWDAEILYFSKSWFDHINDPKWKPLYYYLRDSAWGGSEIWRNQFIWNLFFSLVLQKYEGRPNSYIIDTVKYLLYMGISAFPGLAPAKDNLAGPFLELQRIYAEDYELKNYPPIIMQPQMFNSANSQGCSVYYSLQFPNAPEFKPSSRMRVSLISDLHEIKSLMNYYEQELLSRKFNLETTSLCDLFNKVRYDYFHNGVELLSGIRDSGEIATEDRYFSTTLDGTVHKNFPDRSSFVKGCIRLSHKKDAVQS